MNFEALKQHKAKVKDQDREGVLNAHSISYILGVEHSIPAIEATINMLQSDLMQYARNDPSSFSHSL